MRFLILTILCAAPLCAASFDDFNCNSPSHCLFDETTLYGHNPDEEKATHAHEPVPEPEPTRAEVDSDGNSILYGTGYRRVQGSGVILTPTIAASMTAAGEWFFWGGLGLETPVYGTFGVQFRVAYGFSSKVEADQNKQTRNDKVWGVTADLGTVFRWPVSDSIRINVAGGPSVMYATRSHDPGTASMAGVYAMFGADFGTFNFSGFVETGVRVGFDLGSTDDDVRDATVFQWEVVRIGIRIYLG